MQTIYIEHPHQYHEDDFPPLVMALGFFDGVHLGHRKVISSAAEKAEELGLHTAVMTFNPHPREVLGKSGPQACLTPLGKKEEEIAKLGADYLFVVRFTLQFAALTPQKFCDHYLIGLNVRHVTAGFDYSYGRLGKGTMETLPFHSRGRFTHSTVSKMEDGEEKISSTRIRHCLREGNTEEAARLLGRFYETEGTVVKGDQRGRTIGFPTANVDSRDQYLIPEPGVYITELKAGDTWYQGMCNVGYKPTFNSERPDQPVTEVHLFDFDGDLYDQTVTIRWHRRLRSEIPFPGIEGLIEQLNCDKRQALRYFSEDR
ncbi:bifunctional riboflavin kinase/FAD synthetase [Alteribacter natronophilus]|uniref:bifunctional riboflavin kinase/FAD synthetase n=1 Tax=Alteribacter natronophilus TaxID=2583810 RepID=UPI00110ECE50|nr:bifunctional riboflavin kinase/FAD synthetase [Alteribacter natronophilus]TMW73252.1 bifunctional riboflavin kinase/FAD synthetase [Alteribacter natronophilus]